MSTDGMSGGALVPVVAAGIDVERPELSDAARDFARNAMSPATLRAYAAKLGGWRSWAQARGHRVLPADPVAFANYLAHVAEHGEPGGKRAQRGRTGQSLSSLRQAVAALVHAHRATGHDEFNSRHKAVAYVLRGIARARAEVPIQAEPMSPELLGRILAWLADRNDPWSIRDAALLSLGYSFARRRSELAGLDLDEQRQGDGFLLRHHDRLEVVLVRHKTAEASGDPLAFPIPRGPNATLVAAIDRWIAFAGIARGTPLLRRVDRHENVRPERIEGDTISKLVKRRVRQFLVEVDRVDVETAKARADAYSGHSLRTGLAVAAADAGADIRAIQSALGHTSPGMSARYAAKANALKSSVHNLKGVALPPSNTEGSA